MKLKCCRNVCNVPLKAIVFVFQELRDDMPSILADVFCILGKPCRMFVHATADEGRCARQCHLIWAGEVEPGCVSALLRA